MCTQGFKHRWGEVMFAHFGTSGTCYYHLLYFSYEDTHKLGQLAKSYTYKAKCPQSRCLESRNDRRE